MERSTQFVDVKDAATQTAKKTELEDTLVVELEVIKAHVHFSCTFSCSTLGCDSGQ